MCETKGIFIDIPNEFHSDETKDLINRCQICDKELITSESNYIIEKIIKNYNNTELSATLFELAICLPCAEEMRKSLSEESKNKILDYFMQKADLTLRREKLLKEKFDLSAWISTCIFKNKSIYELGEYHLFAHCRGDQMIIDTMPYMVSFEAEDEMQELLSEETKRELDDFMRRNFRFPPEFEDIFKDKPLLVF